MKTSNEKQERVRVGTVVSEYGEILNEIYKVHYEEVKEYI